MAEDELAEIRRLLKAIEEAQKTADCCAYCGVVATEDEHVIPYSYIAPYTSKKRRNPRGGISVIVRSCRSCNSIAGPKVFDNFWEKKQFIAERLATKNSRLLNSPDWTDSDINALSGKLKRHVFASQFKKKLIRIRLENLEKPEAFGEIVEYE